MADLRKIKQQILKQKQIQKHLYQEDIILDEDFPLFYTAEVLQILDISRVTLFRIRREIALRKIVSPSRSDQTPKECSWEIYSTTNALKDKRKASCENSRANYSKGRKSRYSIKELNEIKQFMKEQHEYRPALEQIEELEK